MKHDLLLQEKFLDCPVQFEKRVKGNRIPLFESVAWIRLDRDHAHVPRVLWDDLASARYVIGEEPDIKLDHLFAMRRRDRGPFSWQILRNGCMSLEMRPQRIGKNASETAVR